MRSGDATESTTRVLVVDDEPSMREFLALSMRHRGYEVQTAEDGAAAIHVLSQSPGGFQIVISDLNMPNIDGMEVLRHAMGDPQPPAVILMTAFATADSAVTAMKLGAEDYLLKPFKLDELYLIIDRLLARQALLLENQELRAQLQDEAKERARCGKMLGRSTAMQKVFELVRKAAVVPTQVLIFGESGTGKELVARALHDLSPRAKQPFVAINCAAMPEELLESELFGHLKGTFTGATADREGLFASAKSGTLFLDEIGEMPLAMQAKLLRVLQERRIRPVGSSQERAIDCRVIAATHRDLAKQIENGQFREDLYFRLNVISIELPALRDRIEDIPLLVEHFFVASNEKLDRNMDGIRPEAMRMLTRYDYPGNVRELQNIVERAVALESSNQLGLSHLPDGLADTTDSPPGRAEETNSATPDNQSAMASILEAESSDPSLVTFLATTMQSIQQNATTSLDNTLAEIEAALIEMALAANGGNRRETAEQLQISERSLRYRRQKQQARDESAPAAPKHKGAA